ncbi:hypothetical protein [Telluribacter sp.]|uniref:hypothetical protein n=1 Tax=Telluribacter sp. TaxID=1978767 RepID=UPI002E127CD1|nr:hypothetical protein [Telluribacter sp.]
MKSCTGIQDQWHTNQSAFTQSYRSGLHGFVAGVPPELLLELSLPELLDILQSRFGFEKIRWALDPANSVASPYQMWTNGGWIRQANLVGVNVRTVQNFLNVVKYALSLPECHRTLHLLPIWEPGVVGSLYGMVSWHLNPEFFSQELYEAFPQLANTAAQLKVVINLLHTMGFAVGMDVIPHTDRFSEMVVAYPRFFEWVRREGTLLSEHYELIWQEVEQRVYQFLEINGTADGTAVLPFEKLFGPDIQLESDKNRLQLLFGDEGDSGGRQRRRIALMRYLIGFGYETLPMSMAPPYRALHLNPEAYVEDEEGYRWYQYEFDQPQSMSRVFGPLTRFKLFESKDDNQSWEIDFDKPNRSVWEYVSQRYLDCQQTFGFDFMRGDMTHVQMRPEGVPATIPPFYDILKAVKDKIIAAGCQHFAFFAESFLAPPDTMGYGDEMAHLEAIGAEVTLGDLQSTLVGESSFTTRLRQYLDLASTRRVAPCFTVMTADKDDPRFDVYYQSGNIVRYFLALFLPDLPSYTSLGFEIRNPHQSRGLNEEYSKLYVFRITDPNQPDKVTRGPYVWGRNNGHFNLITQLRLLAERFLPELKNEKTQWLVYPDPTLSTRYLAWRLGELVFVVNLNIRELTRHVTIPDRSPLTTLRLLFSSGGNAEESMISNSLFLTLLPLQPAECRIYRID